MSEFFASGGQSIGVSASTSVLSISIHSLFPLGFNGFDLLVVQVTLKSLLQHYSSEALVLQHSAFFMVQLSYPYLTTGKTMVLTIRTYVSKMMSLLFKALSRFVIAFLSRSKSLLI